MNLDLIFISVICFYLKVPFDTTIFSFYSFIKCKSSFILIIKIFKVGDTFHITYSKIFINLLVSHNIKTINLYYIKYMELESYSYCKKKIKLENMKKAISVIDAPITVIYQPKAREIQLKIKKESYSNGFKVEIFTIYDQLNGFYGEVESYMIKGRYLIKRQKYKVSQEVSNKLNPFLVNHLFNQLSINRKSTVRELTDKINRLNKLSLSYTTIYKYLRQMRYEYRYKRKFVGIDENTLSNQMKLFFQYLNLRVKSKFKLYFMDSSTFKLYDDSMKRWSKEDKIIGSFQSKLSPYLKLHCLLCIENGLISHCYKSNLLEDKLSAENFLIKSIRNIEEKKEKAIIILDNALEHFTDKVAIELKNVHYTCLLFIPQGVSVFNACEYLFCYIKKRIMKIHISTLKEMKTHIDSCISEVGEIEIIAIRKRWIKEMHSEYLLLKDKSLIDDTELNNYIFS